MTRLACVILALCLLPSCTAFTPPPRDQKILADTARYSEPSQGELGTYRWWEHFGNEELNGLVQAALGENFDMKEAWAKLKQARASSAQAEAALWPQLNYDGGYNVQKSYTQTKPDTDHVFKETEQYSAGLAASYEIDLWGKLAAADEASALTAFATREDAESLAMTVAANVVQAWGELLGTRQKIALLQDQIKTNAAYVELLEFRYANSMTTALVVAQQRETLAATKAELPLLLAAEKVQLNTLALLTGQVPGKVAVDGGTLPTPIALPNSGLPVSLLGARPDIRAAGMRLESADWSVAVARADRLPSISLSATAALQSAHTQILFSNWISTLTASITGPIFDGGQRKAEVERTRAVAEQMLAQYGNIVLSAVHEVENNLVNEARQSEYIVRLEERLSYNEQALDEAKLRYLQGQGDFLSFLTELSSYQSLERSLVTQRVTLLGYRIALYRSLGGDWTRELAPTEVAGKPNESSS